MSISIVRNWERGNCTHPDGPGTDTFAPELCCPDRLSTYDREVVTINCGVKCIHHKDYEENRNE